ncbi:unnamed protein product, partial [marine sediment metagenome]
KAKVLITGGIKTGTPYIVKTGAVPRFKLNATHNFHYNR